MGIEIRKTKKSRRTEIVGGMGRMKLVWMMMMMMMMNICVVIMAVKAEKAPSPSPSPNSPVPRKWSDPREVVDLKLPKLPKFHLPPKFHLLCICVMRCDQTCKAANPYPAYLACFFGCLPIKCNPWRLDAVYHSKTTAFASGIYIYIYELSLSLSHNSAVIIFTLEFGT